MYRVLAWRRSVDFLVVFGRTTQVIIRWVLCSNTRCDGLKWLLRWMSTRWKVLLLLTRWVRARKVLRPTKSSFRWRSSGERSAAKRADENRCRPGKSLGEGPMRERLMRRRSDAVASMAAPPVVTARFDNDVGLGGFKLAQIVHFDTSTSREVSKEQIVASDVEGCRRLSILLGQIQYVRLYNFTLTAKFIVKIISVQNIAQKRFYRFTVAWP